MPKTKRQIANDKQREAVAHIKALSGEMGYTMDTLSKRVGVSAVTLRKRFRDPKQLTIAEIDKICQVLHPDEKFEMRLRGISI